MLPMSISTVSCFSAVSFEQSLALAAEAVVSSKGLNH